MKRILSCVLCLFLLCGCTSGKMQIEKQKINIVATIFPLYDFARAICGDSANVKMLIKPGSEVHSYDPLPSDMAAVYDCDLFLYIGGESDTWVNTVISDTNKKNISAKFLPLIDCVETIDEENEEHSEHSHEHADEHIWTSADNAVSMIKYICKNLCGADPENADIYLANSSAYIQKIEEASQTVLNTVSMFKDPFMLVADRFPFAYFARQYKIGYDAAFDGCAVSTDISLKTMVRLTDIIKSRNIKTVFCTELSNQNIAKALRNETGVNIIELHSAHNVTLDDFKNGITYVDILYRNADALKRGL